MWWLLQHNNKGFLPRSSPHCKRHDRLALKLCLRTSLVVQWLRICLPMQGTQVRALVQKDPTCRGATKLPCATTTEPALQSSRTTTTEPTRLGPVLHHKRSHRNEKPAHHNKEQPPPAPTRESPHVATKTQHSQKTKI